MYNHYSTIKSRCKFPLTRPPYSHIYLARLQPWVTVSTLLQILFIRQFVVCLFCWRLLSCLELIYIHIYVIAHCFRLLLNCCIVTQFAFVWLEEDRVNISLQYCMAILYTTTNRLVRRKSSVAFAYRCETTTNKHESESDFVYPQTPL